AERTPGNRRRRGVRVEREVRLHANKHRAGHWRLGLRMELDEFDGSHADVGVAGYGLHDGARRWCVPVDRGDLGFDLAVLGRYATDASLRDELERLEVTSGDADLLVAEYLHVDDEASLGPCDLEHPFGGEVPLLANLQRKA